MPFRTVSGKGPSIGWSRVISGQGPTVHVSAGTAGTIGCQILQTKLADAAAKAAAASAKVIDYLTEAMEGVTDFNSAEFQSLVDAATVAGAEAAAAASAWYDAGCSST